MPERTSFTVPAQLMKIDGGGEIEIAEPIVAMCDCNGELFVATSSRVFRFDRERHLFEMMMFADA